MAGDLSVRTIVLSSGERFPVLAQADTGLPLFEPTIYALTEIRARNQASSTIEQSLRAIMLLLVVLHQRGIDLSERMRGGAMLALHEIDDLARYCKLPMDQVLPGLQKSEQAKPPRITSMEKYRLRQKPTSTQEVCGDVAATRIRIIRGYLDWLAREHLSRQSPESGVYAKLSLARAETSGALTARIPSKSGRRTIGQREGAGPEVIAKLLEVIDPKSPENPWESVHARVRNELTIRWLHGLGLRRGELLNVKISDIDFRREEVVLARRADDRADPRKHQPKLKTRDRKLPLSPVLCELTHHYVTNVRRHLKGARKHEFLLVADKTGDPLSLSSLNKVFKVLREKCPELPETLVPHVLRHTWNDAFSEAMDRANVGEAEEQQMRSFLMGWSLTSPSAFHYTKRHIRKKSQKVSLALQAIQTQGMKTDE